MDLNDLKKEMPYKFRVQQAKEYGVNCVAYIDSRDVQDLLDSVVGIDKWQDKYIEVKGNLFCSIGILCGDAWVWKTDCGTESNVDKQKGEASDAFKRAAVKWGIGRFLYSLGIPKLKAGKYKDKFYPADAQGNILWNPQDITRECKRILGKPDMPPAKQTPPAKPDETLKWKKSFNTLVKMSEHEAKMMGGIWLIIKANKPDGVSDDCFKYESSVKLFRHLKYWPISEEDQEKAINFLDKEFKK